MTLSHLVEGMSERRHKVSVIRPRQNAEDRPRTDGLFAELLCPGMPIPGYSMMRLGLPVRGRLLRAWQKDRPDIVHLATEGPLGYAALLAARKLALPISSSFHTNFHSYSRHYGCGFLTRPALAYLRHFHNRTQITLSPTLELNQQLTADGFENMCLLSRGVNTKTFSPAHRDDRLRTAWGVGPDDLAVIHVSRVAAEKNFPLLIAAFESIRTRHPSAKFIVTSDGPLRRKLERQHPWIRFTGTLPREDLARHYASADLFLYPSLTETFGNVVTEAMASGLPVVAFNYAAAARFIRHGENGWHVPLGNRTAFLAASTELSASTSLRQNLGSAARLTAEGISWDRVIDGFESDLLAVIARHENTQSSPVAALSP
ncbi:MAG: glycosyltransferase family 1 protein [Verrucomicrobia bacterium]|nr:glycosyltransferase family 1 protein [Verrucomicrobiota bacterium]